MSVENIRQGLLAVVSRSGVVDRKKLDALMLEARDGGGIDATERAELLAAADNFDDAGKQQVLRLLSVVDQKNAFVDVEPRSALRDVEGRYATLSTDVKGLTVRVGLFDNTFAVSGRAKSDGVLQVSVEGQQISVPVKRGDRPDDVLEAIRAQLPASVTGEVISGDAALYEIESYKGPTAAKKDPAAHLVLFKPEALGLRPGEKPLRVVVTGYGKFDNVIDNPSAKVAQALADAGVPGAIVEYRRLDVTHRGVDAFIDEMKKSPPDVILSMGVGPKSQVEEAPENKAAAGEDGDGKMMTAGVVRPGAPDVLKTDLPVATIDEALKRFGDQREVGTSLSDPSYAPDRSAYLCNYLGFNLAHTFGETDATTAGFMHVTDHTPVDQPMAVLQSIVARQLDWRREQDVRPAA